MPGRRSGRRPVGTPSTRPIIEPRGSAPPFARLCSPALCAGRPPSAWWRAWRSPPGSRRRSCAAACKLPPPVVTATAATAPFALCVLVPRSRKRDVAVICLQMWAYVATYQMPNDDPARSSGGSASTTRCASTARSAAASTPTLRLQRAFGRPGRINALEQMLIWSHWIWFLVPHGTAPTCCCATASASRAARACSTATFDLGLIGYWAVPTAPPWYAAAKGRMADGRTPELRRMMFEYGEQFWRSNWQPLYGFLGGIRSLPCRPCTSPCPSWPPTSSPTTGPSPARSAGPTRRRSASRSSTSASTTSSTSPPGWR